MEDYRLKYGLKRVVYSILLLLGPVLGLAQEKTLFDSLSHIVNGTSADTLKINALLELSKAYMGTDDQKAFVLAHSALNKSEELKHPKWIGFSLNRIGTIYDITGKPDSATMFFMNALRIFESIHNYSGLAAVYQNIGAMHYYQKDFDKAIENYRKALPLREKTGEKNYVAQLFNNIGSVMRRKKEYDSAIFYYEKSLVIKKGLNDKQSLASSYLNISVAYQYKNDFAAAIENINKAITLCLSTANDYDLASCYITLSEIYLKMHREKEARQQALLGLEIAKKLGSNELLFNGYEELSLCDTLKGDYKSAFANYTNAVAYRDEVYSQEKAKAIGKLQTLYETEKKDSEIKLLNADNETKTRQQKLLLIVLLLSVILLLLAIWAYLNKQKHNRVLARQKREIENKTEQLKDQAAQIARLSSQMNPHFLFNALNSLQRLVLQKDEIASLEYIGQLSHLMRSTLNNSSKEYINLEDELAFLNLYLAFEKSLLGNDFTYTLQYENLDVHNIMLPPMMIQPLAENAVKHGLLTKGGKKELFISFETQGTLLLITVRDNGVGRAARTEEKNHVSMALSITSSRIVAEFEKSGIKDIRMPVISDLKEPSGTEVVLFLPLIESF